MLQTALRPLQFLVEVTPSRSVEMDHQVAAQRPQSTSHQVEVGGGRSSSHVEFGSGHRIKGVVPTSTCDCPPRSIESLIEVHRSYLRTCMRVCFIGDDRYSHLHLAMGSASTGSIGSVGNSSGSAGWGDTSTLTLSSTGGGGPVTSTSVGSGPDGALLLCRRILGTAVRIASLAEVHADSVVHALALASEWTGNISNLKLGAEAEGTRSSSSSTVFHRVSTAASTSATALTASAPVDSAPFTSVNSKLKLGLDVALAAFTHAAGTATALSTLASTFKADVAMLVHASNVAEAGVGGTATNFNFGDAAQQLPAAAAASMFSGGNGSGSGGVALLALAQQLTTMLNHSGYYRG